MTQLQKTNILKDDVSTSFITDAIHKRQVHDLGYANTPAGSSSAHISSKPSCLPLGNPNVLYMLQKQVICYLLFWAECNLFTLGQLTYLHKLPYYRSIIFLRELIKCSLEGTVVLGYTSQRKIWKGSCQKAEVVVKMKTKEKLINTSKWDLVTVKGEKKRDYVKNRKRKAENLFQMHLGDKKAAKKP